MPSASPWGVTRVVCGTAPHAVHAGVPLPRFHACMHACTHLRLTWHACPAPARLPQVEDVPKVWNAKMKELLGDAPPSDAQGCLQDVHWSAGLFGYFPTYTLGAMYATQVGGCVCLDGAGGGGDTG